MPIYHFKCKSCEKEFEGFAHMDERNKVNCECGGGTVICIVNSKYDRSYERKRFPYYDECLDKTFQTLSEKNRYLKEKGIYQY